MILAIILILFVLFCLLDAALYVYVVERYGPQNELWPGSGFYVAWKYRNKP